MSALRKLKKNVNKGVITTARFANKATEVVKDGTIDIIKEAKNGIREGLTDEKSRELQRSNSGHFHESDEDSDDPDLSRGFLVTDRTRKQKQDQNNDTDDMAAFSVRPREVVNEPEAPDSSDEEMYLDLEPQSGEMGLNDGDDDSAKAIKKKKKIKKIKYRKVGDDSDASDGSDAKSAKSAKSSKSSKSGKSKKKRVKRGDASVGSRRKKKEPGSPTRVTSNASVKSEGSKKKKKKKVTIEEERLDSHSEDDFDDERMDALSPLGSKKDPVLPVRSRSPTRSPGKKKKAGLSPPKRSGAGAQEHPIKRELERFSDIWKTQAGEEESPGPMKRESLTVGSISAALGAMGELNGEIKEADPYDNEVLDAKLRSTEQKLHDSEAKVEELIIAKSEIQKELNEEQLRNDELGRRLLFLEDQVEELQAEKKELEDAPKVIEQQADPIQIFELQQEVNTLKCEMSLKVDQHADALHQKSARIKELEAQVEAGGNQPRESIQSVHTVSSSAGDAKTQGMLLRSNDKIQKQEAEIKELKQKLEELGNAEIIENKDEEIKNLGVQMFELETKMKEMEEKHDEALKQKDETISFFQDQVVDMQKRMPKPAAYTRKPSTDVGDEGTMTLGGEGSAEPEEGGGLWGLVSRASPGLLGGRATVDRRRAREAPPSLDL